MLFVNPGQIEAGLPYAFSLLDAMLDAISRKTYYLDGHHFDFSRPSGVKALRLAIKSKIRMLDEADANAYIIDIGRELGTNVAEVADHARPVGTRELKELVRLGGDVQNHGWTHRDIASMSGEQIAEHISRGRAWLQARLGQNAQHYAVPFGTATLPEDCAHEIQGAVFLADNSRASWTMPANHWNRFEITRDLQLSQ